jgi:hypothetical protein
VYDKVEREYKITLIGDPDELDDIEGRLSDLLVEAKEELSIKTSMETVSDTPIDDEESEEEEEDGQEEDDG